MTREPRSTKYRARYSPAARMWRRRDSRSLLEIHKRCTAIAVWMKVGGNPRWKHVARVALRAQLRAAAITGECERVAG